MDHRRTIWIVLAIRRRSSCSSFESACRVKRPKVHAAAPARSGVRIIERRGLELECEVCGNRTTRRARLGRSASPIVLCARHQSGICPRDLILAGPTQPRFGDAREIAALRVSAARPIARPHRCLRSTMCATVRKLLQIRCTLDKGAHRETQSDMNRDDIERDWSEFRAEIRANWTRLTNEQLDTIAGKRSLLANEIQEAYGVSGAAAQRQIAAFEERCKERRAAPLPDRRDSGA